MLLKSLLVSATIFLSLFFLFFLGMAPGLSLQDSGELVTAVHSLGVPHPPGYPLFILVGQIFKLIPFSSVVFRLNLMSVFFSALAAAVMGLAIRETLLLVFNGRRQDSSLIAVLISGALFATAAPSAYRQAVITEVYALNTFLCAVMIWLLVKLLRLCSLDRGADNSKKIRHLFYFVCLTLGLTLANHHTSWYFGLLALLVVGLLAKAQLNLSFLIRSFGLFVFGLSTYAYLPWAASQDPVLNWGDPVGLRSFAQHVLRFQYDPKLYRPTEVLVEQLREQVILLLKDYPVPLLFLGALGLFVLFERSRKLFWLMALGLMFSGPLTSLVANFEMQLSNRPAYEEASYLLSVFFLPHYLFWGLLIAVGSCATMEYLNLKKTWLVSILLLVAAAAFGLRSYWTESKHGEQAALNTFENWETATKGRPALIVTNWDPFYFPSLYLQEVEGRAPQLVVVDTELMRTPWYLRRLREKAPRLMVKVQSSSLEYEESIEKVLAGNRQELANANRLFAKFLNAFIDTAYDEMPVYLALHRSQRLLPAGVAEHYTVRPTWIFGRLEKPAGNLKPSGTILDDPDQYNFSGFVGPTMKNDYVLRSVTLYHIQLLLETSINEQKNHAAFSRRALSVAKSLAVQLGGERAAQLEREIEKASQLVNGP